MMNMQIVFSPKAQDPPIPLRLCSVLKKIFWGILDICQNLSYTIFDISQKWRCLYAKTPKVPAGVFSS